MTPPVRRILAALGMAVAIALVLDGATIFRIEVWKIVLAIVGFLVYWTGREPRDGDSAPTQASTSARKPS